MAWCWEEDFGAANWELSTSRYLSVRAVGQSFSFLSEAAGGVGRGGHYRGIASS